MGKCYTCAYADFEDSGISGKCRKAPPILPYSGWPTIAFDDWCGAYWDGKELQMKLLQELTP